ncbi:hypothetical protein DPMN_064337 [Dreissena polymorpha]|uniref:Uncharacterized protein n=1 Tax=Dreissena polymorpha TaxID=45954 RepID=A0A9D4HKZ4_DREPO|nr:hypothetical protein DPMN_064337 [Dreissena polymorpha]
MNSKSNGATDAHENSCTPLNKRNSKRGTKRAKTRTPGSESSVEGDLSYLDQSPGRILSAAREHDTVTLTCSEFDTLMNKLDMLQTNLEKIANIEKCISKLDKLDKLDAIEISIKDIEVKLYDMDHRLTSVEKIQMLLKVLLSSSVTSMIL